MFCIFKLNILAYKFGLQLVFLRIKVLVLCVTKFIDLHIIYLYILSIILMALAHIVHELKLFIRTDLSISTYDKQTALSLSLPL